MKTERCKNCQGVLAHSDSIAIGLDGRCVNLLKNPKKTLAVVDALEAAEMELRQVGLIDSADKARKVLAAIHRRVP